MGAAALVWSYLADRSLFFASPPQDTIWMSLLSGTLLGVGVVLLTYVISIRFLWARKLNAWFYSVLGRLAWQEAFILAALSSVSEEMFFRGAMQPDLGLELTTLIFGLMHFPSEKRFLSWTVMATVLGYAFGWLCIWTGNILGAITAHFLINFTNLQLLGRESMRVGADEPDPPI
jgi:membrane protease YdiL (CAAX protease family)